MQLKNELQLQNGLGVRIPKAVNKIWPNKISFGIRIRKLAILFLFIFEPGVIVAGLIWTIVCDGLTFIKREKCQERSNAHREGNGDESHDFLEINRVKLMRQLCGRVGSGRVGKGQSKESNGMRRKNGRKFVFLSFHVRLTSTINPGAPWEHLADKEGLFKKAGYRGGEAQNIGIRMELWSPRKTSFLWHL